MIMKANKHTVWCIILVNLLFKNFSNSVKILVVFPTPSKSHSILGVALVKGLIRNGHNVTFVSPFPQAKVTTDYYDIALTKVNDLFKNSINQQGGAFNVNQMSHAKQLYVFFEVSAKVVEATMEDAAIQNILHSKETYNLIILSGFANDALVGLGYHFNAPLVVFSSVEQSNIYNDYVGNPSPYSYVSEVFFTYGDRMTFVQRLLNTFFQSYVKLLKQFLHYPKQNQILHKYFPNAPDIYQMGKFVALILTNSHLSVSYPRPLVPNVIEVGGLHVPKPKPLPKHLQEFMDQATDGVIYFSLGTNIPSKDMPVEMKESLLTAFTKLKQKVLWKWDEPTMLGLPNNVRLSKWYPQSDILAHPNIKLFITHAGLLSLIETVVRGVPCIGIPVYGDQYRNIEKAVQDGYAIFMDFKNITIESMSWAISEVLYNSRYSRNVKQRSAIFNDQMTNPLDKAIYWIEYVIRHKVNCLFINYSNCDNILVLFPTPSKSHSILGVALAKGLAKKGHNVTFVSPFKQEKKVTEYNDLGLTGIKTLFKNHIDKKGGIFTANEGQSGTLIFEMFRLVPKMVTEVLDDEVMKKLMNSNEKYDAIILSAFLNDALLALGNHFKAPMIIFSTSAPSFLINDYVGNPSPYSYVPEAILPYSDRMTFFQRLANTGLQVGGKILKHWLHYPAQNEILRKYFPDVPDVQEIITKNVALVLANSHPSLGHPRPLVPNLIEVGGLQVPKPNPLPKDLQEFMDQATEGVIYFSLGTNVPSKDMPIKMKNGLIAAFAKLKQKVLWKWDDPSIPGLSKNVRLSKWYPQGDILAHPNVKLFITHGGLLSTTETVMRGVPCIGIPIFADQFKNMDKAERDGYAITIDHKNITETTMTWAINEILSNPKYRENVKRRSALFNDEIVSPLDKAVYWVEYVIRHKGAPHLKSAGVDIPLYQYLLLDIISFILFILFIIFSISYLVIKNLIKFVKNKFIQKKDKKD